MIELKIKNNNLQNIDSSMINESTAETIDYFKRYMGGEKVEHLPYIHQFESFKKILNDEEILLTAGTSSGKTLAHAVPLFYKIKKELIDKILLLYPTRALLQDQKRVMDELATVYKLEGEVSEIKGGMTRSQLIKSLNKKIIIATPDAIYWFFNKNIKYNSFLIYGLSQVDEVVIDEAHLFSGLVLNNLNFLIDRMKKLSKKVGKIQRYHILTATANESLKKIFNNEVDEITGKSNCGDINLEISYKDKFIGQLFEDDFKKLVNQNKNFSCVAILNSAKTAHQIFYSNTNEIDVDQQTKGIKDNFTYTNKKISIKKIFDNINNEETENKIRNLLEQEKDTIFKNINIRDFLKVKDDKIQLNSDNDTVFAVLSDYLEEGYNRFKKVIEMSRNQVGDFIDNLEENIASDEYVNEIYEGFDIKSIISIYDNSEIVMEKLNEIITMAKDIFHSTKSIYLGGNQNNYFYIKVDPIKYPEQNGKTYLNYCPKLSNKLGTEIYLNNIKKELNIDDILEIELDFDILKQVMQNHFDDRWIQETIIPRYFANWENNDDVLVVLYTGSMSNYIRDGLIKVFNNANYTKKILISTSAVEVGLDFNCDLLMTEETNVASSLQRFGRAGRNGKNSKVKLFVSEKSYTNISNLIMDRKEITRDEFSKIIEEVFDEVTAVDDKEFLEAYHYIINKNLGRIGIELNQEYNKDAISLGEKLRGSIDLNYGLRETMPSLALKGGVTKNPFYILRFLENGDLYNSDSPFEIARSDINFDSLIWKSYKDTEDVYVDINLTLKYSKLMFINEGIIRPYFRDGICERYESEFLRKHNIFVNKGEKLFKSCLYNELKKYDQAMLKYLITENHNFMLGFGDVFLQKDSGAIFVGDRRLNIPNQFFLFLAGNENKQKVYMNWLRTNGILDYEEIIIDDMTYENKLSEKHRARNPGGIVLLENINGALFYLYKKLIKAKKEGEL